MTDLRRFLGLVLLLWGLVAGPAYAYDGVGVAHVERALGHIPQSEDELDDEIKRLEELARTGLGVAESWYTTAVLRLNRPESVDLDLVSGLLHKVLAENPGYEDAIDLYLDLVPIATELNRLVALMEGRISTDPNEVAAHWVQGRTLHALGKHAEAITQFEIVERLDPGSQGQVRWFLAVIAGEKEDAIAATRYFEEALLAIDEETAGHMWRSSVFVADPEESKRYTELEAPDRIKFFQTFWKRRDIFPLTDENERLAEHFRRLAKAKKEYSLRTNGNAYFTMHDRFQRLSPKLPFYDSTAMFDYQERVSTWLDHRGLIYVRHGEPDRKTQSAIGARSHTWLFYRWTNQPLLFTFVDRRGIGAYVLVANLAQAMVSTPSRDDPEEVLLNAGDFQKLYATRSSFHVLYQRVAMTQSVYQMEDLLLEEARMMTAFIVQAWIDDTSNLIDKDDLLPFAAYSANFRSADGGVETFVYYAIPEKELKKGGPVFEFDATIAIFSDDWQEKITTAEHHFRYERPAGTNVKKSKELLVGVLRVTGLESGKYSFSFQVRENGTDKIGVAKGELVTDYYGPEWVDVSDLLLAAEVTPSHGSSIFERNGYRVIPIPTRTLLKSQEAELYYEIYDLQSGADGKNHYRIEYRILQIQAKPGILSKLFNIGMNVAGLFFPYHIFLTQAGLFGVDVIMQDPDQGLSVWAEERETTPTSDVVSETWSIDPSQYSEGIYQVYVTVKDRVSGAVSTRKLRFAISK